MEYLKTLITLCFTHCFLAHPPVYLVTLNNEPLKAKHVLNVSKGAINTNGLASKLTLKTSQPN